MKFRKKPVVIEAMQLTRSFADVCFEFVGGENIKEYNFGEFGEDACYLKIKTLEGIMTANEGDWIIKGVNGEFYPCKPDIFEKTYDPVHESSKCHFCGKPELGMSGDDLCECEEERIP